jgi:hypothetical protein
VAVACALAGGALGALGLLLAQRRMASSASIDTPHFPRDIGDHDRLHQHSTLIHPPEEVCKVYFSSYSGGASGMEDAKSVDEPPPFMGIDQLQLDRALPAIYEQSNELSSGTSNNSQLAQPFGVPPIRGSGSSSSSGSGHRVGTSTRPSEVPFGGVHLPPPTQAGPSLGVPPEPANNRPGSAKSMFRRGP